MSAGFDEFLRHYRAGASLYHAFYCGVEAAAKAGEIRQPAVPAASPGVTFACGGCGETDSSKRCLGCRHDFGDGRTP